MLVCTTGLALETGIRYKRKYPNEPAETVRGNCWESRAAEADSVCSEQQQPANPLKVCDREDAAPLHPSLVESAPSSWALMLPFSTDFSTTSSIPG